MPRKKQKRIVVKLGTGVLTSSAGRLDLSRMKNICAQIAEAMKNSWQVILVSSGAVGLGMGKLGLKSRPKQISSVQKCAAVGQGILIQTWAELFEPFGISVAQLLLTRDDLDVLPRHKAMRDLIDELLADSIVPIINENDSVSAAELNIKFGDNDVLSALVATLSKADELAIISTAPGLIDMRGTGEIVRRVEKITPEIRAMAGGYGRGRNDYKNKSCGNRHQFRMRRLYSERGKRGFALPNLCGGKSWHCIYRQRRVRKLAETLAGAFRKNNRQNFCR